MNEIWRQMVWSNKYEVKNTTVWTDNENELKIITLRDKNMYRYETLQSLLPYLAGVLLVWLSQESAYHYGK